MELIKGHVSARPASQAGGNPPVGIGADGTIEGARPACKFVSDGYSLHMGTRARDDKREDGKQEHAWVHDTLLSGTVENRLLELFSLAKVNGTIHTCMGQEFSAVAFARQLRDGDFVFSNHRCHGHYISFTKDYEGLLAELMGKAAGTCGGIGSSQHLCKENFYSNGIQGGIVSVAAGFACGIDIESIAEMPRAGDPREEPFYRNNFTLREISYCLLQPDPWASFAGLFCAKDIFESTEKPIRYQGKDIKDIVIGNDVWIASNAVILPGAKIGDGTVIGAGAIVKGIIPPYSVAMGNPAKVIATRRKIHTMAETALEPETAMARN